MAKIKKSEEKTNGNVLNDVLEPTYPLLKRLRDVCPGTFKHSQSLAAIVEGVSVALELDVISMRVAAMYHDVGKIVNPKYFSENQLNGEDPHEKMEPWISSQFISKHVSDTVALLINDNHFPRKIIETVSQHHGSTIIQAFFNKANTDIEDNFRYKGTKPKDIESAVLMLCDQVEAKSRSWFQNNKFNANSIIDSVTNHLLNDGQLDDVYMRLGDLKLIKESLIKELEGLYQKRVDYDSDNDNNDNKTKEKNGKNGK